MSDNQQPSSKETDLLSLSSDFNARAYKADQLANQLEKQARQARQEAAEFRKSAQVLDEAHRLVARERAAQAAAERLSALLATTGKGTRVVFLIDGSGSMQGSVIEAAIGATEKVAKKTITNGGSVHTILFGDQEPQPIDVMDEAHRARAIKGLNCGTDLAPALDVVAKTLKKSQPTHVIVLSDGDMFDAEASKNAITTMLQDFPEASFDAVQIGTPRYNSGVTSLKEMMERLAISGVKQVPKFQNSAPEADSLAAILGQLVADRTAEQPKAAKRPARRKQKPRP